MGSLTINEAAEFFELRRKLRKLEFQVMIQGRDYARNFMSKRTSYDIAINEARTALRKAQWILSHELSESIITEEDVDVEDEFLTELAMRGEDVEF